MPDDRDLPTSRLGRLVRFAGLGTRAGLEKIAGKFGRSGSEAALAAAAAKALGTMRGLALKLGQMASYVDGFVPEEHRQLYEDAMRSLRDAAPTMPTEAVRRVVESELGRPPESLFAEWCEAPIASASLGQVHRACLHDGRQVAVKVQYEGVADAVAADLANSEILGTLLRPVSSKFGLAEQLAEMRARFLEELDYLHEAQAQKSFAAVFTADSQIKIPVVIHELTSRRVLTTELATGLKFDAACSSNEEDRKAWAETLWRFVFANLLGPGYFNADPHPGNYLFGPQGRVCFLDFGCTRTLSEKSAARVRKIHQAILNDDLGEFFKGAHEMLGIPENVKQAKYMRDYLLLCFEPMRARRPYRLTHKYASQLMAELRAGAREQLLGSRNEFVPLPAEFLFFNRLQLGFYSVLARLDATVDYRALHSKILSPARAQWR